MDSSFEMRELEAFVAVVECGSFTGAAHALRLTQPTVSARIASLEAALSTQLLDRGPAKTKPTPAGKVFLPHARSVLRGRRDAVCAVQNFLSRPGGTLEVGASTLPGTYLLPRILADLRRRHPRLRLHLTVEDTETILGVLRHGEVELAVVGKSVKEKGISGRNVGQDEIVLVACPKLLRAFEGKERPRRRKREKVPPAGRCSPVASLTPGDLRKLPLVLRESGSATRAAAISALARKGLTLDQLDVVLEVGNNAVALEAALACIGATFLSRLAVEGAVASGQLVVAEIDKVRIQRPLVVVTRTGETLTPAATELIRLLT